MITNMVYLLPMIICVVFALLLLTTFIGTFALPFLNTSKQGVRDLFLALKDLTLPMGSFPSRLLEPWTSEFIPQAIPTETLHQVNEDLTAKVAIQTDQNDEAETPHVEGESASEVVEETNDILFDANQTTENEPTKSIGTDEQSERICADLSRMVTEKEALEAHIRQAADPKGSRGLAAMDLDDLIKWMMHEHERSTNDLRMKDNKREDELYDAKQVFEAIVIGQNLAMQQKDLERVEARLEARELKDENLDLRENVDKAKEKYEERKEKWRRRIRTAEGVAEDARLTAEEATTGVESRIKELRQAHANEVSTAAFQSFQERNSITCSKRMVQDSLAEARTKVIAWEQQHEATVKENQRTVNDLKALVRQLRSEVTTSELLTASAERRLQERREEQCKEKDSEINTLRKQLRESQDQVKSLDQCKATLERMKQQNQRLSGDLEEQTATLRTDKEHVVGRLKLDIGGLERTIKMNEATIRRLQKKITGLQSGQEIKDLKAEAQRHLHQCATEIRGLKQKISSLELETAALRRTIEDNDKKVQQDSGKWAAEKRTIEQALKQTKSASDRSMRRKVRKFKGEKQGLSRTLRAARSNEQSVRTQVQALQREQAQTTEQYRNAMNERGQKIQTLEQTIVDAKSQFERQVGLEVQRQLEVAVSAKEESVRNEAKQQYGNRKPEDEEEKTKAVEEAKKTIQAQLDSERRTHLESKNEATKTESDLRAEIGALKSQIDGHTNAAEAMSIAKADSNPGDDTKELAILAREVDEAYRLFAEIEEHGIHKICGERHLLIELNKAKKVLASVKHEAQQAEPDMNDLLDAISEAIINKDRFPQCDSRKRPVLLGQARAANERLQSLQRLFRTTFEVQKDAVFEILQSPTRHEANSRRKEEDSNTGEASKTRNMTVSGASETTASPATPGQPTQQDQPQQQESGAKGQGEAASQPPLPPLPGLFQSQSADQAPSMQSLPPRSAKPSRQPVVSQPPGEIKVPRGFTRQMRQWAKGWVRSGDIERAEKLMFENFPLLRTIVGQGLRSYLVELKEFVEGQTIDQMEQPGGWTEELTALVENSFQEGQDTSTIIYLVNTHESYTGALVEMQGVDKIDGVDMYVAKLKEEFEKKPAQKPVGWTNEMTETVMTELRENIDTEFEYLEELLDGLYNFKPGNKRGLMRYLERLKANFKPGETQTQRD